MNIHEAELIEFVVKEKKERILAAFDNPKRRKKVMAESAYRHFFFNSDYEFAVPRHIHTNDLLYNYLKDEGAPDMCYIISSGMFDGQEMKLADAIASIHGRQYNTVISCIPGKLLYFEGESPDERYLVKRK